MATSGAQRIVFEIDAEGTSAFSAALQKAAASLKELGDITVRESNRAVTAGQETVGSNERVSGSYQSMARSVAAASAEQITSVGRAADAQTSAARRAQEAATVQTAAADRVAAGYAKEALAAKASAAAQEAAAVKARAAQAAASSAVREGAATITGPGAARDTLIVGGGGADQISGARGTTRPGSITNPIVVAVEAGRYTGMGSRAAAIGQEGAVSNQSATKDTAQEAALSSLSDQNARQDAAIMSLAAGGSGGGGKRVDIFHHSSGDGGGGGGGGGGLGSVLYGRGALGLAGFGTAASFAGLGPEHLLMTGLGLAGSAGAGLAGGGLLAAGSLGKLAVGGGSDAAVMKSTIADTQTLYQDYAKITQAVAVYGKNSKQASVAQAQLNADMANLGNTAGVKAEAGLAKATSALNTMWDQETSAARVAAVSIMQQVVGLGRDYVPKVASAAQQNLAIINTALKPLFSWLGGPQGMGIWNNLENEFKKELPTAIHAFDQAIELVLREINIASTYTGGFVRWLDRLFTRLNEKPDSTLQDWTGRLVGDFHMWGALVKALGHDLRLLFSQDAGTAQSIVVSLTQMLQKLGQWEASTQGSSQLHNIFEVHKQEILALLGLLPSLVSGFGHIYMSIAPAFTLVLTGVLTVVEKLLNALVKLSPATADLVGLALVAAKLGVLKTVLGGIGAAINFVTGRTLINTAVTDANTAAKTANAAATGADAAANEGLGAAGALSATAGGTATGAMGMSAEGAGFAMMGLRTMLAPVLAGLGGILAGSTVQHVAGLRGGTGGTLAGGVAGGAAGAAIGTMLGGPVIGTMLGAAIGSTLGPTIGHALDKVFGSGKSYGTKFSDSFIGGFASELPNLHGKLHSELFKAANEFQSALNASRPLTFGPGVTAMPSAASMATLKKDAFNLGYLTGQAMVQGLQSVRAPSTFALTQQILSSLGKLPAQARPEAARVMLLYAQGLEQNKELPKGAVNSMIHSIEQQFPAVAVYLKQQGLTMDSEWAGALKMQQAQGALKQTLASMKSEFGLLSLDPNANGTKLLSEIGSAYSQMKQVIASSTGQARQDAVQSFTQLQQQTQVLFSQMASTTQTKIDLLANSVKSGSKSAADSAYAALNNFDKNVFAAMNSGAESTGKGMAAIVQNTNEALKKLGQKQLSPFTIEVMAGAGQAAMALTAFPTGGYVGQPGERGRDSVGIVVGRGEAILNHQQQAVANSYLTPIGGLAGLFKQTAGSMHYMSSGGYAGFPHFTTGGQTGPVAAGSPTGGYVYPFPPGTVLGRTDQGVDANMPVGAPIGAIGDAQVMGTQSNWFQGQPMIWEKLLSGPMAGRFVYLAEQINNLASGTLTGNQALAHFAPSGTGIEMGWATASGQTLAQATSGYSEGQVTAAGQDFRNFIMGLAHGQITGGAVGGGAGGAAVVVPHISAPKVQGGGVLGQLTQGAFNKVAGAANAYLGKYGSSGGNVGGTGSVTAANLQTIAKGLGYNWDASQIQAWLTIIAQESGGNPTAQNPTSTAYGIGQFLDSTWGSYGTSAKTSNPHLQLVDMAKYIHGKYGTPAAAEAYHLAHNSYGGGGFAFAGGGHSHEKPVKGQKPGKTKVTKPPHLKAGLSAKDLQELAAIGGKLQELENDRNDKQNQYTSLQTRFQAVEGQPQFTNPDGSLSAAGIAQQKADDATLLGLLQGIYQDYEAELPIVARAMKKYLGTKSVVSREIAADRKKLQTNKLQEATIRQAMLALQKPTPSAVTALQDQIGKLRAGYAPQINAAESALVGYQGRSTGTLTRLKQNLLNARQNQANNPGAIGSQANALESASANAAIALQRYELGLSPTSQALHGSLTAARLAEQNALAPLEMALADAKIAEHQRAYRIKVKTFAFKQQLQALSKEDLKLSNASSNLKGMLSGSGGQQGTNTTISLLESLAQNLGLPEWNASGQFVGIDTTNQGAAYDTYSEILSLDNTIGQLGNQAATSEQQQELVPLLQQQNLYLSQAVALSNAQFGVLSGMLHQFSAGSGSLVGSFAHGGPILSSGMALVHRGEWISPDPQGPYGSQLTAPGAPSAAPVVNVHLHDKGIDDLIDMHVTHGIERRAPGVTSYQLGRRSRAIANAPGRPPAFVGRVGRAARS
jgi:hypothetical protein